MRTNPQSDPLVGAGVRAQAPTTIVDVARVAGVSVSTVSRVIRGHDEVSEDTRVRVQSVIDRLAYRPSGVARALVAGYSKTVGLVVSDITNPFYPQLAKSVEREADRRGYALVICNTEDNPVEAVALIRRLFDQGVDGVIHASVGRDEDDVLAVAGDTRRIVFVNRRPRSSQASYVVADNVKAAALLTQHMIDAGHRRIGFVGGPSWAANAQERLDGFLKTTRERGAEALVAEGDFTVQSGSDAVVAWIESGNPPTAVIGVNDTVALGAVSALVERSGPALQMAVGGFDDTDLAGLHLIGLTSVAQHIDEMGRKAMRLLLRQLAGKTWRATHLVLEPTLHVRRSSIGQGIQWGNYVNPSVGRPARR